MNSVAVPGDHKQKFNCSSKRAVNLENRFGVNPIYATEFFEINTVTLSPEGKGQIKLTAKSIKANPNAKFVLNAYADKNTGYPALKQRLTEKRAKVGYDARIAEGVNPAQLE